ncbi:hypothetical protein ASF25_01575 [Methylobacterium sp. Leaf100]|nr:hypothetical protein ASF25_01575 [Methylobacterium sp. Leaf100]
MNALAQGIDEGLNGQRRPKTIGFALLVFEFGKTEGGRVNYVSNAERSDMITAVKEWLARAEGRVIETETKQ